MKIAKTIILSVLFAYCLQAAHAQKIDQIEAVFVDGKIQVSCMLQTTSLVDLSLHWSDNDGASFYPCWAVSGDLTNQSSGMKKIVWDSGTDGIIMGNFIFKITCLPSKQQVVIPANSPVSEKKNKTHFLLMPGIAVGNTLSGTLTLGFLSGKWGGYAKVKSNFVTKTADLFSQSSKYYYADDFSKTIRYSVSAGINSQVAEILLIYVGIGYGSKYEQWKTIADQMPSLGEKGFHGMDPEVGLVFKTGKFLIGIGASMLFGNTMTAIEANVSLGFIL